MTDFYGFRHDRSFRPQMNNEKRATHQSHYTMYFEEVRGRPCTWIQLARVEIRHSYLLSHQTSRGQSRFEKMKTLARSPQVDPATRLAA
jgi:hypothetical protein